MFSVLLLVQPELSVICNLEFCAGKIKLLTQYRLEDEFVDVYRNPLCGKCLPAVLVFQRADDVPIVAMVLNRTEGRKRIVGLEDARSRCKEGEGGSSRIHLPARYLNNFFQQRKVALGVFADIERMSLEKGSPCHFCTPKGFVDIAAHRFLGLRISGRLIIVGCWWL